MQKYLERTKHLEEILTLSDFHGFTYKELTRPEKFKGHINKLKIEYFNVDIGYGDDGKIFFKEKSLRKADFEFKHRIIKYVNDKKVRDYTVLHGTDMIMRNYFYKYDKKLNLIEIINPHPSKPNDKHNYEHYTFGYRLSFGENEKGLILNYQLNSKTYRGYNGYGYNDQFKYNSDGLLIKELWTWQNFLWTYKYDTNNRLVEKIGQRPNKIKTKIEGKGPIPAYSVEPSFFSDKKIRYKETFDYYEDGKLKRIERENDNLEDLGIEAVSFVKKFSYDDEGNKIILEDFKNEIKNLKTIYNKNGEILSFEETSYFRPGTKRREDKFKWTYEYDELKNWIYCVEYFNNKPILITRRTFDY